MSWRKGQCQAHSNRRHAGDQASRCGPRESERELNLAQQMMLVHPVIHVLA
jgi:hypothetical protein